MTMTGIRRTMTTTVIRIKWINAVECKTLSFNFQVTDSNKALLAVEDVCNNSGPNDDDN